MLVEVMCDEFKDHGKPRGRISLKPGLNTVMGSASGSNSIGKSTFLMIIDFIFGKLTGLTHFRNFIQHSCIFIIIRTILI